MTGRRVEPRTDGGAVFLDKDGTLVENVPFNVDVARIRLVPGAGDALRRLAAAGWRLVVVTNQSGIARGLFGEEDLAPVRAHLAAEAGAHGAALDGFYYCPHLPEGQGDYAIACDCRKPAPGLLRRAARELSIDLAASWLVGDTWMDVGAGRAAGCRTILVGPEHGAAPDLPLEHRPDHAVPGLREAAAIILGQTGAEKPATAEEPAA